MSNPAPLISPSDAVRIIEEFSRVAARVASELDVERLVQAVTDAGRELTGAAFGAFFYNVVDNKDGSYLLYTLSGVPRSAFEKFPMPRNTELFGPTFEGKPPVRIDDVLQDPRYGQNPPHHGMPKGHLPVRSYLAASVVSRSGEVIGGLFYGHPEPGRFTALHETVLSALGAQAAVAIDNARLYREAQVELEARRAAQQQAEQSHQRLELAQDSALMGTWEWNIQSGALNWSPQIFTLHGLPLDSTPDFQAWLGTIHPEDRQRVQDEIQAAVEGGSAYSTELRTLRPNGQVIWTRAGGKVIRDKQGTPLRMIGFGMDITARKVAEEALAMQGRVLESMVEGVSVTDEAGKIVYTNPAEDRMFGYERGELLGKHVSVQNAYPPEENQRRVEGAISELKRSGVWTGEWLNRRKDGSTFITRARITALAMQGKSYWVCVQEDITAEQQTQEALRASEMRFRGLFEQSPLTIIIYRADGRIAAANRAFQDLFGISPDEVPDYSVLEDPQIADRAHLIRRAFAGEPIVIGDNSYTPDRGPYRGQRRWLRSFMYPVMRSGQVMEVVLCHDDITAMVEAREAQASSEQRLRIALLAGRLGTWMWSAATDLVDLDERAAEVFGWPHAKPITWQEMSGTLLLLEFREGTRQLVQNAAAQRRTYSAQYQVGRPNGDVVWVEALGQPIYDPLTDALTGMIGTVRDITRDKLQQDAMRKSERLAAAGRLAATVAHEINNPLEAVTNLLYLALHDPSLSAASQGYLRAADEELRRVAHLARRTLGFYRDTRGPADFQVAAKVENLLEVFSSKIANKGIKVETRMQPLLAHAVAGEVEQVLTNLLANAIDACGQGCRLILTVRPGRRYRDGSRMVRVTVADTAGGIAVGNRQRIFEPFFTTKQDVGTGLGLWVTNELVQKNGGSVRFKSRSSGAKTGTVFTVFLPAAAEAAASVRLPT